MISVNDVANILDGQTRPVSFDSELLSQMVSARIVVVYGESDDLMKFDGYLYDEVGCGEGGHALIDKHGVLGPRPDDGTDERMRLWLDRKSKARRIDAIWSDDEDRPPWSYRTDIPHKTFRITDECGDFCHGIVFSVSDL